jgi:hypothetical protein
MTALTSKNANAPVHTRGDGRQDGAGPSHVQDNPAA